MLGSNDSIVICNDAIDCSKDKYADEKIAFTTSYDSHLIPSVVLCGVSTTKFRKSCNSCSRSKKKCVLLLNSSICTGCKRLNATCVFAYKLKSGPQTKKRKLADNLSGTSTDGEDSVENFSFSENSESDEVHRGEFKEVKRKRIVKAHLVQHSMQSVLQYAMSHYNIKMTMPVQGSYPATYTYLADYDKGELIATAALPTVMPFNFLPICETTTDTSVKTHFVNDSLQAAAALCGLKFQI